MRRAALLTLLGVAIGAAAASWLLAGPSAITPLVQVSFPRVDWIDRSELQELMDAEAPIAIVDARSREEFEVSHLPGAHWGPEYVPDGSAVVVYCSVGWRSAEWADSAPPTVDVRNLEGGVFAWANEGRVLTSSAGPTRKVHAFGFPWSLMLAPNATPRDSRLREEPPRSRTPQRESQ